MRSFLVVLILVPVLLSLARADEVGLHDGTRVEGAVLRVEVEGHGMIPRAQLASVRLAGDRALLDAAWIERLLRFALDRSRRGTSTKGSVGVYLGRGVFPPSAIAVVRRLDEARRSPRLVFEPDMRAEGLAGLKILIVPGGWAPAQLAGLGSDGQAALAAFVREGGRYLGICAGGYLPCAHVVWQGVRHPYPLGLLKGTAAGPVPGRAPWPRAEVFELSLEGGGKSTALYAGGSSFAVPGAVVVARYPGGAPAAVEARFGKGWVLVSGAHIEFRSDRDADLLAGGGWATGRKPGDARLLGQFLARLAAHDR